MTLSRYEAAPLVVLKPRRGEDLMQSITAAMAAESMPRAWVRVVGTLRDVEVRDHEANRSFATPCRIVSLEGLIDASAETRSGRMSATASRASMRGAEVISGSLVRASADDVEVLLMPLLAGEAAATGSDDDDAEATATPARVENTTTQRAASSSPWDAVADASSEAARPIDPPRPPRLRPPAPLPAALAPPSAAPVAPRKKVSFDDAFPEAGDVIDHFAFGRARVLRSDGDEMLVHDDTTGRTRTIMLAVLRVEGPIEEGGLRLFRLTQRRGA